MSTHQKCPINWRLTCDALGRFGCKIKLIMQSIIRAVSYMKVLLFARNDNQLTKAVVDRPCRYSSLLDFIFNIILGRVSIIGGYLWMEMFLTVVLKPDLPHSNRAVNKGDFKARTVLQRSILYNKHFFFDRRLFHAY